MKTVLKYEFTRPKVFSDGKIESHDGTGDSGSKCFNGTQESEVEGDGRDGQCKTVYVVDWLSSTRGQVSFYFQVDFSALNRFLNDTQAGKTDLQVDLKRIWTHEIGVSFPTEKVLSLGAIWKNCHEEDCSKYYQGQSVPKESR